MTEEKLSFASSVLKTLYAPRKALKEAVQNQKYYGPILIMILFVIAQVAFGYIVVSKLSDEQVLPAYSNKDEWIENSNLWISDARIAQSDDAISGLYYGNRSIEFDAENTAQMWMQINFSEPVDCASSGGYKNISFRMKQIYPDTIGAVNASLCLLSGQFDYFYLNLTNQLLLPLNVSWNNLTVGIGPGSGWTASPNADWSEITSLRLEVAWFPNGNATVRLDALFFRGVFKPVAQTASDYIYAFLISAVMQFIITWVLLGGSLHLLAKGLGAKTVWKTMLILAGFCLVPLFLQALVGSIAYSTLPMIYRPIELFTGVEAENQIAYQNLIEKTWTVTLIDQVTRVVAFAWVIALCTIAVRVATELSWARSVLIAIVAYIVTLLVASMINSISGL